MKLAGKTDIGNVRKENQDNFRAARLPDDIVWAVVCDGMGGAAAGQLASQLATDTLEDCFGVIQKLAQGQEREFLLRCMSSANRAVYMESIKSSSHRGMGTTAVCALVRDGTAHIVHAGDSRAYLCRHDTFTQLTRDHSMVQQMVESGKLTHDEAATHPNKNLITRALGIESEIECDYQRVAVQNGDILLLCSDGLTGFVSDDDISDILQHTPFFITPRKLIERALKAGGKDNITALLIGVEPTEE